MPTYGVKRGSINSRRTSRRWMANGEKKKDRKEKRTRGEMSKRKDGTQMKKTKGRTKN